MSNNFPWRIYFAEFLGTALLVFLGLSLVIFMFGIGSPMTELLPSIKLRQTLTGFLFGSIGASIALSAIGKESGAHINPAVTMVFWLFRKMDTQTAIFYVVGQLLGGIVGSSILLAWGELGASIAYGATLPGPGYTTSTVLMGEIVTTFVMISLLLVVMGFRKTRPFTPAIFPILYAIMIPLEASISGTSTNPARSLGPAVVSGVWQGWWIYWIGPLAGAFLASFVCSILAKRIETAKLYHFDSDRYGLFKKMVSSDQAPQPNQVSITK